MKLPITTAFAMSILMVGLSGCDDDYYYGDGYTHYVPAHDRLPGVAVAHDYQTALTLDADGDGHLDIFLGQWVSNDPLLTRDVILFNNGAGRFLSSDTALPKRRYSWAGSTMAACVLDYDNDSRPDIFAAVTSMQTGRVSLQLMHNDGHGVFADAPTLIPSNWIDRYEYDAAWCGAVDIDNDGNHDILLRLTDSSMRFLRRVPDAGFVDVTDTVTWTGDTIDHAEIDAAFGDLNNDNLPDLLHFDRVHSAPALERAFAVLTNTSTPGALSFSVKKFQPTATLDGEYNTAVITDLDNDGANDVVLAQGGDHDSDDPTSKEILFFKGDGDGNVIDISATANVNKTTRHLSLNGLLVNDFDGDGAADVFASDFGSLWYGEGAKSALLQQTASLQFSDNSLANLPSTKHCANASVAGDFRGTGHLDIFVATQLCRTTSPERSFLLLNDGSGKFTLAR